MSKPWRILMAVQAAVMWAVIAMGIAHADGITLPVPVTIALGGTGITSCTSHGLVVGQGTSAFACTAAGTSGDVLTSNGSSADPTFQAGGGGGGTAIYNVGALSNPAVQKIVGTNLSTGDNDLYTVPANRRCLLNTFVFFYNQSAGSITTYVEVKIGGSYYRFGNGSVTLTTLTSNQSTIAPALALEAGDSLSVNSTTTNGLNVWASCIEYDTSSPIKSPRLTSIASGNNTLYTVPTGHTAATVYGLPLSQGAGGIAVFNASGAGVTYIPYIVPNGQSVGANYQLGQSRTIANNANLSIALFPSMADGDSLIVNSTSSTAGQFIFTTVQEL